MSYKTILTEKNFLGRTTDVPPCMVYYTKMIEKHKTSEPTLEPSGKPTKMATQRDEGATI